jgi:hypothetical protein
MQLRMDSAKRHTVPNPTELLQLQGAQELVQWIRPVERKIQVNEEEFLAQCEGVWERLWYTSGLRMIKN